MPILKITPVSNVSSGSQGAQGPQGFQGESGASSLNWHLVPVGSDNLRYPATGDANLYVSGTFLQLSVNTVNPTGIDVTDWIDGVIASANHNSPGFLTISQESSPGIHRTIRISGVSQIQSLGGVQSFTVSGSIISTAGGVTSGSVYRAVYDFAGSRGFQGIIGTASNVSGTLGEAGSQGPQGYYGDYGHQGSQGAQGLQGYQGHPGVDDYGFRGQQGHQGGPEGPQGDRGTAPQGPTGYPAAAGPQGPQGLQGPSPKGVQGPTGPIGIPGPQGPQGNAGPQGVVGAIGPAGFTGNPGVPGLQGPQGSIGLTGPKGSQGIQGNQGHAGHAGVQGIVGFVGVQGVIGDGGPQGYQGLDFKITKTYASEAQRTSASGGDLPADGEHAVIAGAESSVEYGRLYRYSSGSWTYISDLSSQGIQGPAGLIGNEGSQGPQGNSGLDITGDRGHQGSQGIQGVQGQQGFQGDSGGAQGLQGSQGTQGHQGPSSFTADTGLIYVSGGLTEGVDLGTGLFVTGSSGSRILTVRPSLPALDANHVYVYNCDEVTGSAALTSTGTLSANLTLAGGEGTAYSLETYRFGGYTPWLRSIRDGNAAIATTTSANFPSGGGITIEIVAVPFLFAPSLGYRSFIELRSADNAFYAYMNYYNGANIYGGIRTVSGQDSYTSLSGFSATAGTMYHYMMVFDPSDSLGAEGFSLSGDRRMKFYVNGNIFSWAAATGGIGTAFPSALTKIWLCGASSGAIYSPFAYVKHVRISSIPRNKDYAMRSAQAYLGR